MATQRIVSIPFKVPCADCGCDLTGKPVFFGHVCKKCFSKRNRKELDNLFKS